MIRPNAAAQSSSQFTPMQDYSGTSFGFAPGLNCADYTIPASMGSFGIDTSQPIPGLTTLWNGYESLGTHANTISACADGTYVLSSCDSPTGTDEYKACVAANTFMKNLKANLLVSAKFRCNVFKDPSDPSQPCDVKDMTKDSNGQWQNTCVNSDGKLEVFETYCLLDEFKQYVQDWDIRLQKVFAYLDDSVATAGTVISDEMANLIESTVLDPIYKINDQFECSFLGKFYVKALDGMCYQGIQGFASLAYAYVVFAIFAVNMALTMFIVYRRTYDNVTNWADWEAEEDDDDDEIVPAPKALTQNRETEAGAV